MPARQRARRSCYFARPMYGVRPAEVRLALFHGTLLIIACIQYPAESVALKHEAVPHAAIPHCTGHFFLVNTVGESELDLACSIEGFQLLGRKHEIQTAEIVLELRYLPRSNPLIGITGTV